MKIISAEYLTSVAALSDRKAEGLPEICFIGRSNVGKSSLINRLAMRKIARTSSTPGATKTINLYEIQYEFNGLRERAIFSDFPGFGYSRISKEIYRGWEMMIDRYIGGNRFIRHLVWAFDIRRDFNALDETVLEWIGLKGLPYSLVLTKSDKEGRGYSTRKKDLLSRYLKTSSVFVFSAKDDSGRKELLAHILAQLGGEEPSALA
ncbi:ribosome biogenesis GTP-binding protein YihA/YsxC [Syntrophorhabdus aromaticivorans]|jgi:GTP-binding protein|uniref:Probable GTP-binding protein EngB n=1 Tax=Syntrophorhabdus aromaticivorans TaxID=328301 RepID=A0A971RZT3_9BACT|nr:ribosome biogenesis GTP-binding protein YihA/YsxC [Syntrophorhabdus aromaticivorans]NLW34291.1 ribosome biogenesis GTP-binding protein YsxC [Syntrophorhabdus aromaticivorans]